MTKTHHSGVHVMLPTCLDKVPVSPVCLRNSFCMTGVVMHLVTGTFKIKL